MAALAALLSGALICSAAAWIASLAIRLRRQRQRADSHESFIRRLQSDAGTRADVDSYARTVLDDIRTHLDTTAKELSR